MTNVEGRMTKEARMSNDEALLLIRLSWAESTGYVRHSCLGIRHSLVIRAWEFVIL
jgi:hypothetical protein